MLRQDVADQFIDETIGRITFVIDLYMSIDWRARSKLNPRLVRVGVTAVTRLTKVRQVAAWSQQLRDRHAGAPCALSVRPERRIRCDCSAGEDEQERLAA